MADTGDVVAWFRARCLKAQGVVTFTKRLLDDYRAWCEACGFEPETRGEFMESLRGVGLWAKGPEGEPITLSGRAIVRGCHLKHEPPPPPVERKVWRRVGPSGPTGPKKRARWTGPGDEADAGVVGDWLRERTVDRVWAETPISALWADYVSWCEDDMNGEPWPVRAFTILLRGEGVKTRRVSGQVRALRVLLVPRAAAEVVEAPPRPCVVYCPKRGRMVPADPVTGNALPDEPTNGSDGP